MKFNLLESILLDLDVFNLDLLERSKYISKPAYYLIAICCIYSLIAMHCSQQRCCVYGDVLDKKGWFYYNEIPNDNDLSTMTTDHANAMKNQHKSTNNSYKSRFVSYKMMLDYVRQEYEEIEAKAILSPTDINITRYKKAMDTLLNTSLRFAQKMQVHNWHNANNYSINPNLTNNYLNYAKNAHNLSNINLKNLVLIYAIDYSNFLINNENNINFSSRNTNINHQSLNHDNPDFIKQSLQIDQIVNFTKQYNIHFIIAKLDNLIIDYKMLGNQLKKSLGVDISNIINYTIDPNLQYQNNTNYRSMVQYAGRMQHPNSMQYASDLELKNDINWQNSFNNIVNIIKNNKTNQLSNGDILLFNTQTGHSIFIGGIQEHLTNQEIMDRIVLLNNLDLI